MVTLKDIARELLETSAKRKLMPGFAFFPDDEDQYAFEKMFPYEETSDQIKAIREIKEETGIGIKDVSGPFMEIVTYAKRYFGSDKNVCNRIFYYRVLSDDTPNLEETNYDELERQSEFGLFYVHIDDLEHFLHNCLENGTIDVSIGREMLLSLEEYNYLFGGVL